MAFTDIEREIEARYVRGVRRIFEFDDEFMYNVSDEISRVIITTDFPNPDTPFKTPHIVITGIGYQNESQYGFSNNFNQNFAVNGIRNYGSEYVAQIPYSVSLICLGQYDVSRNLANRLAYYVDFEAYEYLSDNLMLNIRNITKSPSSVKEQYPEKIFQTPVTVQGILNLAVNKTPFNYLENNRSQPINKLGKTFTKVKVSVDNK
jgi:hypothetical protein